MGMFDWLGDATDVLGDVAPWLYIGSTVYDQYNRRREADQYRDDVEARDRTNYERGKANYDAYLDYLSAVTAPGEARWDEEGRLAALGKAQKRTGKIFRKGFKTLQPYRKASLSVLPGMTANALQAQAGMNDLYKMAFSSQAANAMKPSQPVTSIELGFKRKY